jgi:hypothetical protein
MPRWTTSDEENERVRVLFERVMETISSNDQILIMKDGSQITGKVLPGTIRNNKGQGVPERCAATIVIRSADQEIEVDALDVETVVAGPLN